VASATPGNSPCPRNEQGHIYKHTLAGVYTCQYCGYQRTFDVQSKEWQ